MSIIHQTQPAPWACAETCLAMILGVPAKWVVSNIGLKHGLTNQQEVEYLEERGYECTPLGGRERWRSPWPHDGLYLVAVPSLNNPGGAHRVLLVSDGNANLWLTVIDPNKGREGAAFYPEDAAHGRVPFSPFDIWHVEKVK